MCMVTSAMYTVTDILPIGSGENAEVGKLLLLFFESSLVNGLCVRYDNLMLKLTFGDFFQHFCYTRKGVVCGLLRLIFFIQVLLNVVEVIFRLQKKRRKKQVWRCTIPILLSGEEEEMEGGKPDTEKRERARTSSNLSTNQSINLSFEEYRTRLCFCVCVREREKRVKRGREIPPSPPSPKI